MSFASRLERVLLCTLNAKYIHSSLALRYLQSYCQQQTGFDIGIKEFTINQNTSDIMAEIYLNRPDVLAFSCYIWNIGPILQLCNDYKKVAPGTVIILGGPEVSYDSEQILSSYASIDYVVRGEGEETLKELLWALNGDLSMRAVAGITYREGGQIIHQADRALIKNLDNIPFPYRGELDRLADRIVYYESSRGCPFRCSYCLSSNSAGVRYFSLERVKDDLKVILGHNVREIKFVDRTFNCNEERAMEIMSFIALHRGNTKIHFEVDAGLFSESMLEFLAMVPGDLFNFEIGVQSTYEPALKAVRRIQNWDRLSRNIMRIKSYGNIHLHLDLIAGLPGEDWENFGRSFNMVYDLEPDVLQLGFLKVLKGSDLMAMCKNYDYAYQSGSPYQVLSNRDLPYEQIIALQYIEDILDKYYNSGDMRKTMAYIGQKIYSGNNFSFYHDLSLYWQARGWFGVGHKKEALYSMLYQFIEEIHPVHQEAIHELLKYDYLSRNHKYDLPEGLQSHNPEDINERVYSYIKNRHFMERYLPELANLTGREIRKLIHMEYLTIDVATYAFNKKRAFMFVYKPFNRIACRIIDLTQTQLDDSSV